MALPIKVAPEGNGYRVSLLDGSDGTQWSKGVYATSGDLAVAAVAKLLGVEHPVQVESDVLTAMHERLQAA